MGELPLQSVCRGYNQIFKSAVVAPPSNKQLQVFMAKAVNNSGGALDLGVVRKLSSTGFSVYSLASAVSTDVSAAIQAGTATTLVTTTNNDGFYVGSAKLFGLIGFTVSQADGGGAVYTYQYWNGTTWATLTGIALPTAYSSTGDKVVSFLPPIDWVVGSNGEASASQFTIKVLATTAGGAALKVTAAWAGQFLDYIKQVAAGGVCDLSVYENRCVMFDVGESLAGYFGAAAATNFFRAIYSIQG